MSRIRIAVFAATVWEIRAVRAALPTGRARMVEGHRIFAGTVGDREYWLVRTGVGHEKAGRVASRLLRQGRFDLVVSTGFACALGHAEIGALIVGREVMSVCAKGSEASELFEMPGAEREAFLAFVDQNVPHAHVGRFMSVDRIVGRASEKREYARATGAIGLDMESAALAIESQRAHVPFVIVRTVSDLLDEDLPLDFNLFLRPTGWLKGIGVVLAAPWSLCGLRRLRRQSRLAADHLTQFFRAYVGAMTSDSRHHPTTEPA